MEEILASIRRIISEDEPATPEEGAHEAAAEVHEGVEPEPEPEPVAAVAVHVPEPEPEPEAHHEDVLELTEVAPEPAHPFETVGDLDVYEPEPAPAPAAPVAHAPLVSGAAADTAASSFGLLAQRLAMPKEGRTLEDLVKDLLNPLLKAWLEENLPAIVHAKVEEEVERISRRQVG